MVKIDICCSILSQTVTFPFRLVGQHFRQTLANPDKLKSVFPRDLAVPGQASSLGLLLVPAAPLVSAADN